MTLIEILAALVILSIVLISFFTMFTQSFSMQNINEKDMHAINLARTALQDVRDIDESTLSPQVYTEFNSPGQPLIPAVEANGQFHSNSSFSLQLTISNEDNTDLLKAIIEIVDETKDVVTKTYSYIEVSS
ncbi:hypothetical protein TMU01_23770 [Tenuibacillus multivorans]|nr:hypothetical protein TMU01_23770 [Tenuibacillus multivorans]